MQPNRTGFLLSIGCVVSFGFLSFAKALSRSIPPSIQCVDTNTMFCACKAQLLGICARYHLLPTSFIGDQYISVQSILHEHVLRLFETLPPTGLYKQDVETFKHFIRHAKGVFASSPRNIILTECEEYLKSEYRTNREVRELLEKLSHIRCNCEEDKEYHPLSCTIPSVSFHQMMKQWDTLSPGKAYKRWQILDKLLHPSHLFTNHMRKSIISGMKEKAIKKGKAISQEELERKMEEIFKLKISSFHQKKQKASELAILLKSDKQAMHYERVKELWEKVCGECESRYKALDKQIGNDRCSRGLHFEERANIVFYMIMSTMSAEKKQKYKSIHFVQSAIWLCDNKPVGELDMVLLGVDHLTGKSSIVGLVEMKANFYCVASALLNQHTVKLSNLSSHTIKLPDNSVIEFSGSIPELFIATLIPHHHYLVGAEKSILDKLVEPLTNPICITSDEVALVTLMETIKEENELTISPREVFKANKDHIFVLL